MARSGSRVPSDLRLPHLRARLAGPRAVLQPAPAARGQEAPAGAFPRLSGAITYLRWLVPGVLALLGAGYIVWEAVLSDGWPVISIPVLLGFALLGLLGPLAAFLGFTWALRSTGAYERAEISRQVLLAERRVEEQTRRCIAGDLHDGVQQLIVGALFELQAARQAVSQPAKGSSLPDAAAHLLAAQDLLRRIETGMRDAVYSLRPVTLDTQGLTGALAEAVAGFGRAAGIPCDLRFSGRVRRLSPDAELAAFRIVQEALNNAAAHAHAGRASVEVAFAGQGLCIEVADDGQGFDTAAVTTQVHSHLGLLGMHERAAGLGGAVSVWSQPGRGTRVVLALPIHPQGDGSAIPVEGSGRA